MPSLEEAIRELYSHEINVSISTFWDAGCLVQIGDEMNGFKAEREFRSDELDQIAPWLLDHAAAASPAPSGLQPYVQEWPRLVSMEEWLAKAHPDAPALPWIADNGVEICSFTVEPIETTGGILVAFYDAHGREVVRTGDRAAIEGTALLLGGRADQLTFLPAPIRR